MNLCKTNVRNFVINNWVIIVILLLSLIIRLKYLTINSAVWYDEARYLMIAKDWANGTDLVAIMSQRAIGLSLLWGLFYKIGLGEFAIRITELIFSMLAVYLTYYIGKEWFNKYIGYIASFFMCCFYLNLFFTARILLDLPGTVFYILVILFFYKGYIDKKYKYLYLSVFFGVVGTLSYFAVGFILFVLILFLVIRDHYKFIFNKHLWGSLIFGLVLMIPYFYMAYKATGNIFPVFSTTANTGAVQHYIAQWFVFPMLMFTLYLKPILTILFLFSIGYIILQLYFHLKHIKEYKYPQIYILLLLWIIVPILWHSWRLYVGGTGYAEPRFLMPIFPAVFILISIGITQLYKYIKTHDKRIALIVCIIIVLVGGFQQLVYADALIDNKKESYKEVKELGLWLKDNTHEKSVIFVQDAILSEYYSGRESYWIGGNETLFKTNIKKYHGNFIIVSNLAPHEPWIYNYVNDYKLQPVYMVGDITYQFGIIFFVNNTEVYE